MVVERIRELSNLAVTEKSNQGITISDRPAGILINIGKSTALPTRCRVQRLSQYYLTFTRQDEN